MNEQKTISKWLTTAGVESPENPKFPDSDKFQLGLNLILEELIEAAESGSDEELITFALKMKESASKIINSLEVKERGRKEGDLTELRDACADMRVVLGNLIHFAGLKNKFNNDLNQVMKSNFSKFCLTEEEANLTVLAYSNGTHPNKLGEKINCYSKKVDDYWVIKREKDNKVLKSIGFKEPNFK